MVEQNSSESAPRLQVLQIVYGALLGGALMFAGVCLLVSTAMVEQAQAGDPDAAAHDVAALRYVWLGAAAFAIVGVLVARKVMPRSAKSQIDPQSASQAQLFSFYFIMTILTGAILEGVSIFGSIILLLGDDQLDVGLALVPLAVMIPFFPTRGGFERFCDHLLGRDSGSGLLAPSRNHRSYR